MPSRVVTKTVALVSGREFWKDTVMSTEPESSITRYAAGSKPMMIAGVCGLGVGEESRSCSRRES